MIYCFTSLDKTSKEAVKAAISVSLPAGSIFTTYNAERRRGVKRKSQMPIAAQILETDGITVFIPSVGKFQDFRARGIWNWSIP